MPVGGHRFDGGARDTVQGRLAGAGATLWRHHLAGGPPVCVARGTVAIPRVATAQMAEALGCRAALELLRHVEGDGRRARVVGDNLAVVRYGAGTARIRRPQIQAHLELALSQAARAGWVLDWQAVRRRLNKAADAMATEAVHWAHKLRAQGCLQPTLAFEWF